MKNSIKILAAFGILILMSFTIQTNNWTGKWVVNFGNLTITKSSNGEYIGVFPNGKLVGKIKANGDLIGTYTRTTNNFDRTGYGKLGEFRFAMKDSKQKAFVGYYKPEGKSDWQSDHWNGKRPPVPTLVQKAAINDIKKRGDVLKDYVKNNPIISWTGTWETDNIGKLKVWVKDSNHVEGKFFKKGSGDYILTGDFTGTNFETASGSSSNCLFKGRFKDSEGKTGAFYFVYGCGWAATDNDFSGFMTYDLTLAQQKTLVKQSGKNINVKGHRTSSSKPNMNTYN